MNVNQEADNKQLRLKAEKVLRSSRPESGPVTAPDKLLYELQVHQIELEMQNQELIVAKFALEQSKAHYLELYDFAPVGYLTLKAHGIITECNLTASNMLGINCNQMIKKRFESLVDIEFKEFWFAFLQQARQAQDKYSDELPFRTANGTDSVFHVDCLVIRDKSELPTLRITLTDITAQKIAEKAVRDIEKRLINKQMALRDNIAEAIRMQVVIQTAIAIAHNIHQPLTAINFCAEAAVKMLKTGINDTQKLSKSLEIISKESLRTGDAIPTLLSSLCAGEDTSQHSVDINTLSNLRRYIACGRVTKRPIFDFVSTDILPNDALTVFPFEDDYTFGILQSNIHWLWFNARCSTLKSDPRYTSNTVFDSFPWPQSPTEQSIKNVAKSAVSLRLERSTLREKHNLPLREIYRILESPGENSLKKMQDSLDKAVRNAYGMENDADPITFLFELNKKLYALEKQGQIITGLGLPNIIKNREDLITLDCIKT